MLTFHSFDSLLLQQIRRNLALVGVLSSCLEGEVGAPSNGASYDAIELSPTQQCHFLTIQSFLVTVYCIWVLNLDWKACPCSFSSLSSMASQCHWPQLSHLHPWLHVMAQVIISISRRLRMYVILIENM